MQHKGARRLTVLLLTILLLTGLTGALAAEPEAGDTETTEVTDAGEPENEPTDPAVDPDPADPVTAPAETPVDVQYHWSADAVTTMIAHGIVRGYEDGRFRPDHPVTREEAAALIVRMLPDPPEPADLPYWDVAADRWSHNDIAVLYATGALAEADFFAPAEPVTRADFARFVCGAFFPEEHRTGEDAFPDIADSTAREAINILAAHGWLLGSDDGLYHPKDTLTRAQAATVLCRIAGYEIIPAVVTLPEACAIEVQYVSQLYPTYAPVGCEATSVFMGLKTQGFVRDMTLQEFLDAMPKTTADPAKGFVGSPYVPDLSKKTRTTIYPPILTAFASAYGNVADMSGSSLFELRGELLAGNPVAVYVTMHWEKPFYRYYDIEGTEQRLLSNNHIVLLIGYNADYGYYVADPYNTPNKYEPYLYWVSEAVLEPIYNERRQAVVIRGPEGWTPPETVQAAPVPDDPVPAGSAAA